MRSIIPVYINRTNYHKLIEIYDKYDLLKAEDIADRIWNTKILWLISMHPDDLQKVSYISVFNYYY